FEKKPMISFSFGFCVNLQYLFVTLRDITVLPCGHTIHLGCVKEMEKHHRYSCPVCSKSICDMSSLWKKLDQVIASTPMPESYRNKMVWVLCNVCGVNSQVQFHVVAHKCLSCNSYNTRQIQGTLIIPHVLQESLRW
ncbi:E3 ubiquitin-protein ligase RZFP34, partial [Stylosanthes scabra]|nr:E3 ubiquitin-protein ligase RZFP34 [Stylosanthes scabra]